MYNMFFMHVGTYFILMHMENVMFMNWIPEESHIQQLQIEWFNHKMGFYFCN